MHRDRKWATFLGRQTGERKCGTYTVFSLQCGKPLVVPYPKGGRYPETPGGIVTFLPDSCTKQQYKAELLPLIKLINYLAKANPH